MIDLREKSVRGGFVRICAQISIFFLRIGSLVVLAHLLEPEDFGLVGMVMVVTGVLDKFRDFGLSTVTIQRPVITDDQVSTLFWLNVIMGIFLGLLSLAAAPVLSAFYGEPRLFWITVVLSSGFLLNAAGVQHSALLQRQMRFSVLAGIESISHLASTAVGIVMALGGFRYWSLIGLSISMPLSYMVGVWLATRWIPGKPRWIPELGSMALFGGTVTMNLFVIYIAYNIDKLLIGRIWGAGALGFYGRAYQLVSFPTESLNVAVGGVAISALSRIQHEPDRLKSYFLRGYTLVLTVTLPITMAFSVFSEDIIYVFLGAKWMDAAVVFLFLSPTVLAFALINPFGWLLYAMGQVGRSLKMALVITPVVIAAYVLGVPYGPQGVAFAFSAAMILLIVPLIAWCMHGTTITKKDVVQAAWRPFVAALGAAVTGCVVHVMAGQMLSPYLTLALGCAALTGTYVLILFYGLNQKAFYMGLLQTLWSRSSVDESAAGA
jgi:O-antigen/teichoic acid export membrane protein